MQSPSRPCTATTLAYTNQPNIFSHPERAAQLDLLDIAAVLEFLILRVQSAQEAERTALMIIGHPNVDWVQVSMRANSNRSPWLLQLLHPLSYARADSDPWYFNTFSAFSTLCLYCRQVH